METISFSIYSVSALTHLTSELNEVQQTKTWQNFCNVCNSPRPLPVLGHQYIELSTVQCSAVQLNAV